MRIVVDTNVFVSALLAPGGGPGALLAAIDAGELTLVSAPQLIEELEEVLARDRFRVWVTSEQVAEYIDAVRQRAELVDDPEEIRPLSRDPDDDYLIALSREQGADALVSGDADLTTLELDDLDIITPRQLLDRLS